MSRPRFWHRVRFKLLLVSLTLLGIPWAGYRFIQETEQFLRDAQDQALQTTASSVANIMHGYEQYFHGVARPGSVLTFRNLYLHTLSLAPQVDGYRDEWPRYEPNFTTLQTVDETLQADIYVGQHERYLYLLLGVREKQVTYGVNGDSVELAFIDQSGTLRRFRIQPEAPGWVGAVADDEVNDVTTDDAEEQTAVAATASASAIRGEWQESPDGYTLELRLPRNLLRDRLSLRIHNASSGQLLASGRLFPASQLGRLVSRSTTIDEVLASVAPAATRIWVTDHQGLVLARAGRLDTDAPLSADSSHMPWFIRELILFVLPGDADQVADLPDEQTQLFVHPVVDALAGQPASLRRRPAQGDAVVVSAAVPIRSSEGVLGAVLVEQTTNAILSIQNLALQRLFGVTLLFFALTSLGLLTFASLLASRITRLRDRVETAVSRDGRILGRLDADDAKDEIGELGRSFASVLDRLHDYTHYLEAMASRLAHEIRTPLTVVRGSLDNADQAPPEQTGMYVERARHGVERLEMIVNRLAEATGLEQAMRTAEAVDFDVAALLRLQIDGLRASLTGVAIELVGAEDAYPMRGVPDLISQALDKLIANAVDFHTAGTPIVVRCRYLNGVHSTTRPSVVRISVCNQGPGLPPGGDIFQSMYSRRNGTQQEPHLGLGLYLVRLICEYHAGHAEAHNVHEPAGVCVTMSLSTPS